ncbi:MAG: hypothetical protein JXB50_16905 [Spirochaetes bacterium]|nr:hypothetical protein [Spirochaetota bacterium]
MENITMIVFRIIIGILTIGFFIFGIIDTRRKFYNDYLRRKNKMKEEWYVLPVNNDDIECMYDILVKALCHAGAPGSYISYLNILFNKAKKLREMEENTEHTTILE